MFFVFVQQVIRLLGINRPRTKQSKSWLHKERNFTYNQKKLKDVFQVFSFHLSRNGGFPGGSDGKVSACNVGDPGFIPGSGRSSREGNGTPFQYSCLENPMDGGAW